MSKDRQPVLAWQKMRGMENVSAGVDCSRAFAWVLCSLDMALQKEYA